MEYNVNIDRILAEQGNAKIVDVKCTLEVKDYRNYFFYTRTQRDRWLIPAIVGLYTLFVVMQLINTMITNFYSIVVIAFALALTAAPIYNWIGYKRASGGAKDVRIAVSPAGIYIEDFTNDSNGIYAWEDIDRFGKSKKLYLFYLSELSAVIIPKRALSAAEQAVVEEYAAAL